MQSPDTYQDDFFRFDFDSKVIFNEKRATKGCSMPKSTIKAL
jgi:hypothetical protein